MPLSTSSSEAAAYHRAIWQLLMALLALCLLAELFARVALPRMSHVIERVYSERQALLAESGRSDGGTKNVVMLGNSLLLWGVDVRLLNFLGSGKFRYSRFVIENTQYWDWYFGLRRLLAEGARPSAAVLLLGASHWLGNAVEGEFFAHTLMRSNDLFLLREQLGLDRTTASNYWFASWSSWLGSRSLVRKNLLRLIFPDIERLTRRLNVRSAYPMAEMAYKQATRRLGDLKAVSDSFGVALVVVLHPTLNEQEAFEPIREAIVAAGLPVVAPVHMEYPRSWFTDGFHLNHIGMEKFTQDLAPALEAELDALERRIAAKPTIVTKD
jgi:hypothetical protein